jgi:propanediol utilization protein
MRQPAILFVTVALLAGTPTAARPQHPDSSMVGTWAGSAQITVPWTMQRDLAVRVTIRDDGSVSGTIGDAQLVDGHFANARGIVARALRIGREYCIEGKMSGMVIRSEAVQRATVRMSIDWKRQTFEGELQTSGTFDGTPEDLILTAEGLVLKRAEGIVSVRRP